MPIKVLITRRSSKKLWFLIRKLRDLKPIIEEIKPEEFKKTLADLETICLDLIQSERR